MLAQSIKETLGIGRIGKAKGASEPTREERIQAAAEKAVKNAVKASPKELRKGNRRVTLAGPIGDKKGRYGLSVADYTSADFSRALSDAVRGAFPSDWNVGVAAGITTRTKNYELWFSPSGKPRFPGHPAARGFPEAASLAPVKAE
jgi:hypothetical protein